MTAVPQDLVRGELGLLDAPGPRSPLEWTRGGHVPWRRPRQFPSVCRSGLPSVRKGLSAKLAETLSGT